MILFLILPSVNCRQFLVTRVSNGNILWGGGVKNSLFVKEGQFMI